MIEIQIFRLQDLQEIYKLLKEFNDTGNFPKIDKVIHLLEKHIREIETEILYGK
jgi:hypothetical protein